MTLLETYCGLLRCAAFEAALQDADKSAVPRESTQGNRSSCQPYDPRVQSQNVTVEDLEPLQVPDAPPEASYDAIEPEVVDLVSEAVQEMESLARNCILVEESYQRYFMRNCGTQKEEAVWRQQGMREEAISRQAAKAIGQIHISELWARVGYYNNEAAQRSNLFRLLLLEKRKLECDGLLLESRSRLALKSSNSATKQSEMNQGEKRRKRPSPASIEGGVNGVVAMSDFLQMMGKAKPVAAVPDEGSAPPPVPVAAPIPHLPHSRASTSTALVHNPYSFDGPSHVQMGMTPELEWMGPGSRVDESGPALMPMPMPPPPSAAPTVGPMGSVLKKLMPEHWHQTQDASKASLMFPAQCAHLKAEHFAGDHGVQLSLCGCGCAAPETQRPPATAAHRAFAKDAAALRDVAGSSASHLKALRPHESAHIPDLSALAEESKTCAAMPEARMFVDGRSDFKSRRSSAGQLEAKGSFHSPADCGAGRVASMPELPSPPESLASTLAGVAEQLADQAKEAAAENGRRGRKKGGKSGEAPSEDHSQLLTHPSCTHLSHWKRLRANRGFAYFVCYFCGVKWRMSSKGVRPAAGAAVPSDRPEAVETAAPWPC